MPIPYHPEGGPLGTVALREFDVENWTAHFNDPAVLAAGAFTAERSERFSVTDLREVRREGNRRHGRSVHLLVLCGIRSCGYAYASGRRVSFRFI